MDLFTQAKTLFMPIDNWEADNPKILILNGTHECLEYIPQTANCHIWQPFYPYAQKCKSHLVKSFDELEGNYDYVFILPTKQKEETYGLIAHGFKALKGEGTLIISAANDAGGQRLPKIFKNLGCTTEHLSKNHAKTLWTQKDSGTLDLSQLDEWLKNAAPKQHSLLDLQTQAGIFGWNKIDKGSELLSTFLPNDLKGPIADFGCGYGYLSIKALELNPEIETIHGYDADLRSAALYEKNLKTHTPKTSIQSFWTDLTDKKNAPHNTYKTILMNPPFHEGKKSDSNIGTDFIKTASNSIKLGGTLYMVANKQLPYEQTLAKNFKKVELLTEQNGFKCYKAIK